MQKSCSHLSPAGKLLRQRPSVCWGAQLSTPGTCQLLRGWFPTLTCAFEAGFMNSALCRLRTGKCFRLWTWKADWGKHLSAEHGPYSHHPSSTVASSSKPQVYQRRCSCLLLLLKGWLTSFTFHSSATTVHSMQTSTPPGSFSRAFCSAWVAARRTSGQCIILKLDPTGACGWAV